MFKVAVNVVLGISKSFASFATFVPFSLLSEITMLYFYQYGILFLLFDNVRTVPTRLSIKLTTIATIPNTVWYRYVQLKCIPGPKVESLS